MRNGAESGGDGEERSGIGRRGSGVGSVVENGSIMAAATIVENGSKMGRNGNCTVFTYK